MHEHRSSQKPEVQQTKLCFFLTHTEQKMIIKLKQPKKTHYVIDEGEVSSMKDKVISKRSIRFTQLTRKSLPYVKGLKLKLTKTVKIHVSQQSATNGKTE